MHICVGILTIIGSDNGSSPDWRQPIIWTNAEILLIGPLATNFSENLIEIIAFSFMKMRLKVLSAKWWPFCLGLNVLNSLMPDQNAEFNLTFSKSNFVGNCYIFIQITPLNFAPMCLIDNMGIGSGDGLALNWQPAITWANVTQIYHAVWCQKAAIH